MTVFTMDDLYRKMYDLKRLLHKEKIQVQQPLYG